MWSLTSSFRAFLLVLGLGSAVLAPSARGAEKYAPDEDVEVFFLNSWLPAKVRDSNKKGEVMAEFTFANTQKTEVFGPEKVRHLYEAGAIARARLWSDASGKFKVKAALLKISGGKVELRTEDMKDVVVSIDKLSPKDQTFVKQFQKQAGIAALPVPALPAIAEFDMRNAGSSESSGRKHAAHQDAQTESTSLQLAADPIRKGLELTHAGAGFPTASHGERLSSLIALGGADNWMLASIGENDRQPTRLMWVALAKGSVKKIQMLPAGEMLMDYHAGSRQMLTYSKRKIAGDDNEHPVLTIWQADPSTEEPQAVVSWNARLPGDTGRHHSVPWVRFATASHIVQRTETHRILAWDIASRRLAWMTPQESFFAPEPRLSAGGKYVYVPEDTGLRIIDSIHGNTLAQIPMNGCSGVGVHADGRMIAVANRNEIFVVDITGGERTRKLNAASVGSPFSMKFDWVTDKLLCLDNGSNGLVLYSLEHELPIWTYTFDPEAYWAYSGNGGRQRSIVDDHLVYAATFSVQGKSGLAVGAVEMPGDKAQAAIASARREDFMAIKPGARFRIEVNAIDHADEIRQAVEKEVQANGWVVDATAPNVLKAEYKRGETQQVQYEMRSLRGGGQHVQSASITPYVSTLTLLIGNDQGWQSGTASGPPPTVMMKEGDSLQSEVDRWNGPTWSFFQSVDIPPEILDPKMRGGVGKTAVTNRGLMEQPLVLNNAASADTETFGKQ